MGFMIALVLASVFLLIYDVRHDPGHWADVFETFVVTVFITEYLLRMWLYNDSRRILIERWEHAELVGVRFRLSSALWAMVSGSWLTWRRRWPSSTCWPSCPATGRCASCAFFCCSGCSSCSAMPAT